MRDFLFFTIFIDMKNLYTESKYEIITNFNSNDKRCNLISDRKYREWCEKAEIKLSAYTTGYRYRVIKEVKGFKTFIEKNNLEEYKKYIKEFNETDPFFKENLKNVNILKEHLKYCKEASKNIDKFIKTNIEPSFLFVYQDTTEMVYDIINKFNTNYTAIAYLLTKVIQLRNDSTKFKDIFNKYFNEESEKGEGEFFKKVFNKYFIEKSEKGESEFYKDLLNYLERKGPNLNEKFDGVVHSIKKSSKQGLSTERYFEKFLSSKNIEYIIFAGNFSFVDLMGVDFMIKDEGLWIPVQVKSDVSHCKNNEEFCQNYCVAPNKYGNSKWIIYDYKDGKTFVREFN